MFFRSKRSYLLSTWSQPALPDQVAKERVKSDLSAHVPDPVGLAARKILDVGAVMVAVQPSSALPPPSLALQKQLGVPQELL